MHRMNEIKEGEKVEVNLAFFRNCNMIIGVVFF